MNELSGPRFGVGRFVRSFGFAFRGVVYLWRTQQNFRVHLAAAGAVGALAAALRVDRRDAALLALSIGLVLATEGINTSIELLLDALSPGRHPLVGRSKDVAAGAVLVAAFAAAVVACLVFLPYLFALVLPTPGG